MTTTDTAPGGWPDPARPGMPEAPATHGPHWVQLLGDDEPDVFLWWPTRQNWTTLGGDHAAEAMASEAHYAGPALTPAEVRAAVAEAFRAGQEDMRERAAEAADTAGLVPPDGGSPTGDEVAVCEHAARVILALPIKEAKP